MMQKKKFSIFSEGRFEPIPASIVLIAAWMPRLPVREVMMIVFWSRNIYLCSQLIIDY
jgi:hypothetical protein